MRKRFACYFVALLVAVLGIAACGGEDEPKQDDQPNPVTDYPQPDQGVKQPQDQDMPPPDQDVQPVLPEKEDQQK